MAPSTNRPRLHEGQEVLRSSLHRRAHGLGMGNLCRQASRVRNVDQFAHGLEHLESFIPHMADVDAAVPGSHPERIGYILRIRLEQGENMSTRWTRFSLIVSAIIFVNIVTGCVAYPSYTAVTLERSLVSFPEVGATETRSIGETLVQSGEVSMRPTATLAAPIIIDQKIQGFMVLPEDYQLAAMGEGVKRYDGIVFYQGLLGKNFGLNPTLCSGTECPFCGGLCIDETTNRVTGLYWGTSLCMPIKENVDVRLSETREISDISDTREFIYSGRSGNTLRFRYREYRAQASGGKTCTEKVPTSQKLIAEGFTQDLTYDLSDGNVIGFRNLKLEVLKVTNTDITYRLLSFF